jgi:hypothetical protein
VVAAAVKQLERSPDQAEAAVAAATAKVEALVLHANSKAEAAAAVSDRERERERELFHVYTQYKPSVACLSVVSKRTGMLRWRLNDLSIALAGFDVPVPLGGRNQSRGGRGVGSSRGRGRAA